MQILYKLYNLTKYCYIIEFLAKLLFTCDNCGWTKEDYNLCSETVSTHYSVYTIYCKEPDIYDGGGGGKEEKWVGKEGKISR
jgi:hypothetical protein